jgi:hypothetical protein
MGNPTEPPTPLRKPRKQKNQLLLYTTEMVNEIEKSKQPSPDDVLAALQSFNDPSIIINMFKELGWNYSVEIRETLVMAKQNANLSIKFKAVKHLRELLREAAEVAGYAANVSQTIKDPEGGQTTFSAKRIAGILNPVKKIESTEIKELPNDKSREIKSDRESNRAESGVSEGTDTLEQFPLERDSGRAESNRDVGSGGTEPPDGGASQRLGRHGGNSSTKTSSGSSGDHPCIEIRPPTGDKKLFPGISSTGD